MEARFRLVPANPGTRVNPALPAAELSSEQRRMDYGYMQFLPHLSFTGGKRISQET
jgi:hypothetical protein